MNLGTMISVVPPARRAGTILTIDQERVLVTLCGYLREYPISDHRAMLEFARGLAAPDIADFLQHAEPLTTPVPFRFPSSRRLRYERVRGYPQGAIAFGDALCSFNPVYGQGMTVAALEAELLTQLLARGEPFDFVRAFYREAARVVDAPWALSTGGDLRFVGATGQRALRLMGRYFTRLACAASEHPQTARKLLRVLQLVERPSALFGPNLIARALLRRAAPPTRVSLPRDLTISGVRS
jgi:2-polyprenyl-6-methoxyphenol hydroxylase-like FAD-dependent oxidoreductase